MNKSNNKPNSVPNKITTEKQLRNTKTPPEDKGLGFQIFNIQKALPQTQEYMKMGIHTIGQFYNNPKQTDLFSQDKIDEYINDTEKDKNNTPATYGANLNPIQERVLEGVIKALTETNYRGAYQKDPDTEKQGLDLRGSRIISKQYEYIDAIPVIKLTQTELINRSGLDPRKQGDKQHVKNALDFLATERFCFYWQRAVKNDRGVIQKDRNGKWVKEDIMEVGTFLRVKYVKKPGLDKLDYYEIQPSPVILDQVDNYFIMIPYTWRKEVEQIMGKNVSKYTYSFLRWLRLQFELIRRGNKSPNKENAYRIIKTWEELAIILQMPESLYKTKKKTAKNILEDTYKTAIKLGYLDKVTNDGVVHTFYLNDKFYYKPGQLN